MADWEWLDIDDTEFLDTEDAEFYDESGEGGETLSIWVYC